MNEPEATRAELEAAGYTVTEQEFVDNGTWTGGKVGGSFRFDAEGGSREYHLTLNSVFGYVLHGFAARPNEASWPVSASDLDAGMVYVVERPSSAAASSSA